ncbi:MAG: hypothetical protein COA69_07125 [Robiginitomaculum sp.]|nr:MAG: hypothetical protein COA69_07125 [Robiginitomaculum sp.]
MYKQILISDLVINPANDRHGALGDESSAVAWLFNNKETHMKNLAMDITKQGGIYEPPLVIKGSNGYVLSDGNRRVTCLKLIIAPRKAPTTLLQKYFHKLQNQWTGDLPQEITCRIETDIDRVDNILLRRHNGSQAGIGQSPWDDRMKRNFIERTGKNKGLNVADKIEQLLNRENKLPSNGKIPRSTLNRLLSSERFLNRVGLSTSQKQFSIIHNKDEVILCLQKITQDLASKKIVLGDLWDAANKDLYLDTLQNDGYLPQTPIVSADKKTADKGSSFKKTLKSGAKRPLERKNLIPATDYNINWNSKNQRQREIWEELQFRLEFSQHPNAIAVLLRVLLELSVKYYIETANVTSVHPNDKFNNKIRKAAESLRTKSKISDEYFADIKKLSQKENMVSLDTLHRYIHSENFSPSPNHLKPIWDILDEFIVQCLNG